MKKKDKCVITKNWAKFFGDYYTVIWLSKNKNLLCHVLVMVGFSIDGFAMQKITLLGAVIVSGLLSCRISRLKFSAFLKILNKSLTGDYCYRISLNFWLDSDFWSV